MNLFKTISRGGALGYKLVNVRHRKQVESAPRLADTQPVCEVEEAVTEQPIPKATAEMKNVQKAKARQNQNIKNSRRSFSFAKGPVRSSGLVRSATAGTGKMVSSSRRTISTPPSKSDRPSSASAFVSFRESSVHNYSVRPLSAQRNSSHVFHHNNNGNVAQKLKFWH